MRALTIGWVVFSAACFQADVAEAPLPAIACRSADECPSGWRCIAQTRCLPPTLEPVALATIDVLMTEDEPRRVPATAAGNAALPEGARLEVVVAPRLADVTVDGQVFVVAPRANAVGVDGFSWRAHLEGDVTTSDALVQLTISPVDDPPTASAVTTHFVDEDTLLDDTIAVTEVDGDPLSFTLFTSPAHAALFAVARDTGRFVYVGERNFNGDDAFVVDVSDGTTTLRLEHRIVVGSVNDAPTVARLNSATAVAIGSTQSLNLGFFGVSDADGDPLALVVLNAPEVIGAVVGCDGECLTLTPSDEAEGSHVVQLVARDPAGVTTSPFVLQVTVAAPSSCAALQNAGLISIDQVVRLDPDGAGPLAAYTTWCDAVDDGGGWELVARVSSENWGFCASRWSDATLLVPKSLDPTVDEDAKLPGFLSTPAREVRITLVTDNPDGSRSQKALNFAVPGARDENAPPPLRALFADGVERLVPATELPFTAWQGLAPTVTLPPCDGAAGLNRSLSVGPHARVGFVAGVSRCQPSVAASYVGLGSELGCGDFSSTPGAYSDFPTSSDPTETNGLGTLWVRDADFRGRGVRASCAAHQALGATMTGLYLVGDEASSRAERCVLGR